MELITLIGFTAAAMGTAAGAYALGRRSAKKPQRKLRRKTDFENISLEESRDLLQIAIEHVDHGIAVFNHDFVLACCNRRFATLLELPMHYMVIGTPMDRLVYYVAARGDLGDGPAESRMQDRMATLMHSEETISERRLENGSVLEIRSELLPQIGLVMTVTDITQRVMASEALTEANEMLEHRVQERTEELTRLNRALLRAKAEADIANLTKTKFLAAASHDLLQPLNAARLYASALLERHQDTPDNERLTRMINSSLDAVEDILAALLDVARMDSGMLQPEMTTFALNDILTQLAGDFDPAARKKGLKLRFAPTSRYVHSDRRLLRRILQNFISNALKYTPSGKVQVGVRVQGDQLRIDVCDTGPGIPEEKLAVMFQEFERIGAENGAISGHGLGLSIVDRMARLMQHKIDVASNVGRGTRFSILVPLAEAPAQGVQEVKAAHVKDAAFENLTVVCVDNEPTIIEGMNALLTGWGARVIAAHSKQEMLDALQGMQRPDVVIADYRLEDGDTGFTVIEAIRAQFGEDLPAALLTADRDEEIRTQAEAHNIVVMYKPVKPGGLKAYLKRIAAGR